VHFLVFESQLVKKQIFIYSLYDIELHIEHLIYLLEEL